MSGSNLALWQGRVDPDVQGRAFATWQMITRSAMPLAFVVAGTLADWAFGPALSASAGPLVGVGPGRGIALLFALLGVVKMLVSLGGYLSPRLRLAEEEREGH